MSNDVMNTLIAKMYVKLNTLIEKNNENLLSSEVISYSQRLDKVLAVFIKRQEYEKTYKSGQSEITKVF
jgi:hypothetical protein